MARSASACGSMTPPVNPADEMRFVDIETKVGADIITPSFKKHLEQFYCKANPNDKARCLELLTSINLGEEIRKQSQNCVKRPHTAMAAFGRADGPEILSPYQTSYNCSYAVVKGPSAAADRPGTTQAFTASHDLSGPIGNTTYSMDYFKKLQRPVSQLRSGTASGSRNNKPHPPQSFMTWRYPSGGWQFPKAEKWTEELTNEAINQVHKRLCRSTYQKDYLGVPQGFQVKSVCTLPDDLHKEEDDVPYSLDSYQRNSYQTPIPQEELKVPTSRYGSNRIKHVPAFGSVPLASKRQMNIKGRTTYDRHYNDNSGAVVEQIRDISKKLGEESLQRYMDQMQGKDKTSISPMLNTVNASNNNTATPIMSPHPPSRYSNRSRITPTSPLINCNNSAMRRYSPACTVVSNIYSPPAFLA